MGNQSSFSFNQKYKESINTSPTLEIDRADQTPYEQLKSFLAYFVDDAKLAYKFYGIWLAQTKRMIHPPSFELALKAAKYTLKAWKDGVIRTSTTGYFSGTLCKLIDRWLEDEIFEIMEEYDF